MLILLQRPPFYNENRQKVRKKYLKKKNERKSNVIRSILLYVMLCFFLPSFSTAMEQQQWKKYFLLKPIPYQPYCMVVWEKKLKNRER